MEENAITKDDDTDQRIEYTFLTPVATIEGEELILHPTAYHYCYADPSTATPPTDDENFENCSSNGSTEKEERKCDPFSPESKIPLPGLYGNNNFFDSTTFIRRRNERERARVRNVNDGFERLRQHLPLNSNLKDKRLSKVETLRFAITYIHHLQTLLNTKPNSSENK